MTLRTGWRRRLALRIGAVLALAPLAGLVYGLAAVVLGALSVNADYRPTPGGTAVFVWSNGIHTDIVVPIVAAGIDWRRKLPIDAIAPVGGVADKLAFGWGDREFYLTTPRWSDLRMTTVVGAALGMGRTVMHVEAESGEGRGPSVRRLTLSAENYHRLVDYLEASFDTGRDGAKRRIAGAHYNDRDAFFEARGHYSLFTTCNEWARRALVAAGAPAPLWSPFVTTLFRHLPADDRR